MSVVTHAGYQVGSVGALLAGFDSYLLRQARVSGTRERYGRVLRSFAGAMGDRSVCSLSAEELDRYLDEWQAEFAVRYGRLPARGTYRGQVAALRSFFSYLERFDLLADEDGRPVANPARRIVAPAFEQRPNDWLRPAEDQALLACPGSLQERFMVAFLRWTGLRVGEATGITLADLDLSPGRESVLVRVSKTRAGRRTVPLVPQLQPILGEWLSGLEEQGLRSPSCPLLATRHGGPLREPFVWRLVKRLGGRAGVRPIVCTCASARSTHRRGCPRNQNGHNRSEISPHTLRRTFGSDLLNRGLRLEVVSKLLGHANTMVTEKAYAELLDDTARTELMRALGHTP